MTRSVLVANRGEIAVRIIRSVTSLGWTAVAAHPADTPGGWPAALADRAMPLPGEGPAAFADVDALAAAAVEAGADLLHPGYGFASEDPALARACTERGVTFVGPDADALARLGDKVAARSLAADLGIPIATGTASGVTDEEAAAWWRSAGVDAAMVKSATGGGGRGMRAVDRAEDLPSALARARSEAAGPVFVEERLTGARHIEVQVVADHHGGVVTVGDRDCSLQRRHQKVIEVAPAPALDDPLRAAMADAAVQLTRAAGLTGVATVEFLLSADTGRWVFLEVNPRLQVEHPVTEAVFAVDLVAAGLLVATGTPLADLGLTAPGRGMAVEARINAETLTADGTLSPSVGTVARFEAPTGPGLRTDAALRPGDAVDPRFDTLVAKVVGSSPLEDPQAAVAVTDRGLGELVIEGVAVNTAVLRATLAHPDVAAWQVDTGWFDRHVAELAPPAATAGDPGIVTAPVTGTVVELTVAPGDEVVAGQAVVVLESMKMEHPAAARTSGRVREVLVALGQVVPAGEPIAHLDGTAGEDAAESVVDVDLDEIRPELRELQDRRRLTIDEGRPEVTDRRHAAGRRTARDNLADLLDTGSLIEYGPLVVAGQSRRRSMDDLIERTPGDGVVGGVGRIDGHPVVAMSYDYTVLAGTQGTRGHRKTDRLLDIAERMRAPVVLFAEGGGGRAGETDADSISGLDAHTFARFAALSGRVPLVGIVSGPCFAGNAALLGCCDVIIATPDASIGMAGPALIEAGGLGRFRPEEVGPVDVQVDNGVIDLVAPDEAAAVATAKHYLHHFWGPEADTGAVDQRRARHLIPDRRTRVYEIRDVIDVLSDRGSVLELRSSWAPGMATCLVRIEGRPVGIVANVPRHLGGAIDTPAADKAARFLQLCDAFDLPVVSLVDTPGFMVGPEAERSAQVRHFSRMFVVGAAMTVPRIAVILRKGYGLGAMGMIGGSTLTSLATLAWDTGEIGGMGLEGAVRLAFGRELDAITDPNERQAMWEEYVARAYRHGKVLHAATAFEVDDVIDPAETRGRIAGLLSAQPAGTEWADRTVAKRPWVDAW